MTIEAIHDSLIVGQRRQMADFIDEYGLHDFWADYRDFLNDFYVDGQKAINDYFVDAVISYHRIRNR